MDKFEEMKTFVTVINKGSLSAAAEYLRVANSAISRRLSDLEARLGVGLLKRTTRRLHLTDAGQQFYQHCQQILANLEEAEEAVSSEQLQLKGTIRMAVPLSFGIKHLTPILNAFLKTHEGLSLELELSDQMVNLMAEGMDMAIRIGQLEDSSYKARLLAPVRTVYCASPAYLQQHGKPETPEALNQHNVLQYSLVAKRSLWQEQSCRLRANNGDVLLQAAIDGLGIVNLPDFLAYDAIKRGELNTMLEAYEKTDIAIYAIYPVQRFLPQRVRLLIDYLADSFGQEPGWTLSV
jgi:DNA-binding transcriptional LysR family regulator